MLREYIQLVQEDAVAQQEMNLITQQIITWLNNNPGKVKNGSVIDFSTMGIDPSKFKSPEIQMLVKAGQINFEPMADFKVLPDGRFTIDMPNASASTYFQNPKAGYGFDPTVSSPWSLARSDRTNARLGGPWAADGPRMPGWIEQQGHKLQINIPTEAITGNFDHNAPGDIKANKRWTIKRGMETLKGMRSTIAHELNHHYNALQGMSMTDLHNRVNNNEQRAKLKARVDAIPPGTDPKLIPDTLVRGMYQSKIDYEHLSKSEPELQKKLVAATRSGDQAAIKKATEDLTRVRQELAVLRSRLEAIKVDPKVATTYHGAGGAYYGDPVELNSRLQQAVEQMAREIKPGLSNEQIVKMVEKSFLDQHITHEFVDPNKMPKSFPNGEVVDAEFKQFIRSNLSTTAPEFQREAISSALKNPQYRKLVNKAIKFVTQQQSSPVDLTTAAGKASWSAKFRAFLTGIPQEKISQSLLPNTWNSIQIGTTRLDAASEDFARKVAAAPKQAIDYTTSTAGKAFKAGGWLLMAYAIYAEVSEAVKKYQALDPKTMTREQYHAEVTKIVTQPVGRFGLGIVAAIFGAALAGTVASPTVVGVLPAALIGAGAGFATAIAADYAFGNTLDEFIGMLVDRAFASMRVPPPQPAPKPYSPFYQKPELANQPDMYPNTNSGGFKENADIERMRKLAGV